MNADIVQRKGFGRVEQLIPYLRAAAFDNDLDKVRFRPDSISSLNIR